MTLRKESAYFARRSSTAHRDDECVNNRYRAEYGVKLASFECVWWFNERLLEPLRYLLTCRV